MNAVVDGRTFEIKDKPISYKEDKEDSYDIMILTLPEAIQTEPIPHDCETQPKL